MVAELDESDGSFELFSSEVAVVTNIDWDHIDHYPTFEGVLDAFGRFIGGRKPGAPVVMCAEDAGAFRLISSGGIQNVVTYGWGRGWNWGAADVRPVKGGGIEFTANRDGVTLGGVKLKVSGEHNVLNSLAAMAAAEAIGVPFNSALEALSVFRGAKRRLQYIGETGGVVIYDDYGHHPRELAATMAALSSSFPGCPIHVIFQPHRYTRTQALYGDFAKVLLPAYRIYLLPIYSADEQPITGVSSFMIADELHSSGREDAAICGDFQDASELVCDNVNRGDIVLTIGAGNVEELGRQILDSLKRKAALAGAAAVGA
jgi:UDP-N-acetylmuramate--alanine ligase